MAIFKTALKRAREMEEDWKQKTEQAFQLPRAEEMRAAREEQLARLQELQAPQYGGFSTTPNEALFQQQAQLANQFRDIASGRTLSPAEIQLRQAMDQARAAQRGAVASARPGIGQAAAQRTAQRENARLAAQQAIQGSVIRAQEQQRAQANLANLLSQQQAQRLGVQELQQRGGIENLRAALATQRLQENLVPGYLGADLSQALAERAGATGYRGYVDQLRMQNKAMQQQQEAARLGGLAAFGGGILGYMGGGPIGGIIGSGAAGQLAGGGSGGGGGGGGGWSYASPYDNLWTQQGYNPYSGYGVY